MGRVRRRRPASVVKRKASKLTATYLILASASASLPVFAAPSSCRRSQVCSRLYQGHTLSGRAQVQALDRRRLCRRAFGGAFDGLGQLLTLGLALSPAIIYEVAAGWMPGDEALDGKAGEAGEAVRLTGTPLEVPTPDAVEKWEDGEDDISRLVSTLEQLAQRLGSSDTFLRLRKPLSSLNYIAAAVLGYNLYFAPAGSPAQLPQPLFELCSLGLGFLVLSRVSSASERFSRARSLWADVVSTIRNVSREAHLWASRDEFLKFCRWLPALPAAMLCHARQTDMPELAEMLRASRGPRVLQASDDEGLSDRDIDEVMSRPVGMSPPRFVYLRIMALSSQLDIPKPQKAALEGELSRLSDALNACEWASEEVPEPYAKQTAGLLFLWLALLPLALPSELGVGAVLSQQLVAFGLLGIEDVGIQLEEPFKVLPLEAPCGKIAAECQALRVSWRRMRKGSEIRRTKAIPESDRVFPCYGKENRRKPRDDEEVIRL